MPTKAELQEQLAAIESGLLDFTAVGEASFLKKTGQTKLTKKEVPRYTDIYKPIYEATKDIKFSLGEDLSTASRKDIAFYTYNPEQTAERQTNEQLKIIEQQNLAVTKQEEAIKTFLAGQKEIAKTAVLQNYLSSILNPQLNRGEVNPFEYEAVDINTREGSQKWYSSSGRVSKQVFTTDGRGTNLYKYYIKLTPAQIAEKKKTTEAIERVRFMSSPTLQKTYAEKYRQQLLAQIRTMK